MATMNTNIKINIVEPGSSTPVGPTPIDPVPTDPSDANSTTNTTTYTSSTDVSAPDTGLFTHGIGGTEATIITISTIALLLTIIATIVTVLYKKHVKQGKVTKLVRTIEQTKTIIKSKKRISSALSAIALLASVGTLAILLANSNKTNTSAMEGGTELTVDVNSEELTIEVGDTPVFAVLPVELTVEEATQTGYTLSAYAEDTNLVSTTDESNIIPMVAINEEDLSQYVSLTDNTWGLSLTEPQDQNSEVYTTLSTDQDVPTILKSIDDYSETNANDKTTIYYGFYITPDTPKGTYEGSNITYTALTNPPVATVTFDGNGLYFNGDEGQTTNTVKYLSTITDDTERYSHTPNIDNAGRQDGSYTLGDTKTSVITIPGASRLHVSMTYGDGIGYYSDDYVCFWSGDIPTMTANSSNCESGISVEGASNGRYIFNSSYNGTPKNTIEADIDNNSSVTFAYATTTNSGGNGTGYGYYAVVTGYDADGNVIYLPGNKIVSGDYLTPSTGTTHRFLGWSTDKNALTGTYASASDFALDPSLTPSDKITVYAVWSPIIDISYDGNNATIGSMQSTDNNGNTVTLSHHNIIAGDSVDLYAPNYKKTGYGFVGWSIDKDAWTHLTNDDTSDDPIIYGPNQTVTIDKYIVNALDEKTNTVTLYAVWSPAEKDLQGNPVYLQHWTGCSALTPTSYDGDTNTLNVGNNTVTALTDNRDGNVYTIARLADGNCWMVENLRLDDTAIITVSNTNNPLVVNGTVAIKNSNGNTYNHLSSNSMSWCSGDDESEFCRGRSYLNTNNTNLGGNGMVASYNSGDYNSQWYSYGNYYNWYSATAGRGEYDTTAIMTASGDICPSGWRLPYGGYDNKDTNGSFMYLNQQLGNTSSDGHNWLVFPNNFIRSGVFVEGQSLSYRGELSAYWSSMHTDFWNAYAAWLNSSGTMWASGHTPDSRGGSVRCVTLAE